MHFLLLWGKNTPQNIVLKIQSFNYLMFCELTGLIGVVLWPHVMSPGAIAKYPNSQRVTPKAADWQWPALDAQLRLSSGAPWFSFSWSLHRAWAPAGFQAATQVEIASSLKAWMFLARASLPSRAAETSSSWGVAHVGRTGEWSGEESAALEILLKSVVVVQSLSLVQLFATHGCSTPGFPVLHHLPKFTQTHVHWVSDAIQLSHPLVSSFPSCLQSFPTSGSFPMSQLFASGGQSTGDSASASVLPMNIQD